MLNSTRFLADSGLYYVAEDDGAIVGAAHTGFNADRRWEFRSLWVLDDHQGRHIGTRLTTLAIEPLIRLGRTPIYCEVKEPKMHEILKKLPEDMRRHLEIVPVY